VESPGGYGARAKGRTGETEAAKEVGQEGTHGKEAAGQE